MGAPRSCCIDQNAGSVMSQENALTDSSRPQNAMSAVRLTGVPRGSSDGIPPSFERIPLPIVPKARLRHDAGRG